MRLGIRLVIALILVIIGIQLLYAFWPILLCAVVLWVIYRLAR
jgi:hypothetical protein